MQEVPLRSSTLVAIVLRLFAIYWTAQALLLLATNLSLYLPMGRSTPWQNLAMALVIPVLYGIMAMLAWIFAESIAVKAAGRQDQVLPLLQLRRADLYGFGVLLIGLVFFLGNLAPALQGIHGLALAKQRPELIEALRRNHIQQLAAALIPCLSGLALALASPRIGRKLVRAAAVTAE